MKDCVFVAAPICDGVDGRLQPALQDSYNECPQLGVVTLVSILKRAGFQCDLFDWVTAEDFRLSSVARAVSEYRLLFISANSMNWAAVLLLLKEVKSVNPDIVTCVGGPHPTLHPNHVAGRDEIDIYVVGEADNIIPIVAESVLNDDYHALLDGGLSMHIGMNPTLSRRSRRNATLVPKQENLNSLKNLEVQYDLYDIEKYCVVPVETSRGCKFRCEFCSIPTKSYWRDYSAEIAVEKMSQALPFALRSKAQVLSIIDDTFTTAEDRVLSIAKQLDSSFKGRVNFDATVVDVRKERIVEAMADYASGLLIGAEVASKPEAKKIKKAATPRLIEESAATLARYGIASKAVYSFIIGFPWHTYEDCMRTLKFASNLILDFGVTVYLQWYWPIPGSEIWRSLEREAVVNMAIVDTPAFFRGYEWFFRTRALSEAQIKSIDEKILLVQSVINVGGPQNERSPLSYTSPFLYAGTLKHMRNPQLSEMLA